MDSSTSETEVVNGKLEKVLVVKEEEEERTDKVRNGKLIKNGEEEKGEVKDNEDASVEKNDDDGSNDNEEEGVKGNQEEGNKEEENGHDEENDDDDDDDDDDDEEEEETVMDNQEEDEEDEEEEKLKELVLDLVFLRDHFLPGAEGEVPLASYVKGYVELNKFIKMLGLAYHFVAYDVKMKLATLQKKMAGANGQYYMDMKTMIKYETENDLIEHQKSMSGTEALLMLHRGLEFARDFMLELLKDEDSELGEVASRIYLSTTGKYHPPLLRTPFSLVLKLLPCRSKIRRKVAKENEEVEETLKKLLPEAISSVTETYNACQKMFKDHDLLTFK